MSSVPQAVQRMLSALRPPRPLVNGADTACGRHWRCPPHKHLKMSALTATAAPMHDVGRRLALEIRAMTRKQIIVKAIAGELTWIQAADILGMSPRHMRRLKRQFEVQGYDGIRDHRAHTTRRKRIGMRTLERPYRLRRERYPDFSIQHFWEQATEKHGLRLSYTWTRLVLQAAGLAEKAPARGKYRRKRERRPMVGMLVHFDGSTHAWLREQPQQDLILALDDADGRIQI